MEWRIACALALLAFGCPGVALALDPPALTLIPGTLRVAGNAQLAGIVQRWSDELAAGTPALRVHADLAGSDVGMAALYTGQAELALLGREMTADEEKAFEWVFRYKPTRIELMTGSVDRPGSAPALVVLVHRDNPLRRISLPQLAALFGHAGEGGTTIRDWGQLGLPGSWAGRAIRLHAAQSESGTGRHFRHVVLADANALNWAALTEYDEPLGPPSRIDDAGSRIADALARDPAGLAIGVLPGADRRIRAVALAADVDGPWIQPDRASVGTRVYPLARVVTAYVNCPPGQALAAPTRQFLQHALSPRGQAAIRRGDGWLPLSRDIRIHQQHLIEPSP